MIDFSRLGFGVQGSLDREVIRELAPRIEAAGLRSLWLNDTPDGDSLEGLKVAAGVTSTLKLGTGVIPLDRRPASAIFKSLASLNLPVERLVLGVGTGKPRDGLQRVRDNIEELRTETTAAIVVGALGPKIRQLGAEIADGLLLSWLTPEAATGAMRDLREASSSAGRSHVRGILYTRTSVEPAGLRAMVAEAARYQSMPAYAANFERIGAKAIDTTIYETKPERLAFRIDQYIDAVDELVLRAITGKHALEDYTQVLDAVVAAG